jgi:hypothetical protein
VPVGAGLGRSVPVGASAGAGAGSPSVPTGAGAADRPQETLYMNFIQFLFKDFRKNIFFIHLNIIM